MNLINASIIQILGNPYQSFGKWFVKVKVSSYGRHSESTQMRDTREECELLKIGDTILI